MTREIANCIVIWITSHKELTEIETIKIRYGLELLVKQIPKLLVSLIAAYLTGTVFEVLLVISSFSLIKSFAHGLHAKTSMGCMVMTVICMNIGTILMKKMFISFHLMTVIFSLGAICVWKYAPRDTRKRPIVGKKRRDKMRSKCLIMYGICFLIATIFYQAIGKYLMYGVVLEVTSILPITYKLLKEEEQNYERFERKVNGEVG